ncbi:MAG: hypothetical protein EOP39_26770, partial [Rubrivivax sp.]
MDRRTWISRAGAGVAAAGALAAQPVLAQSGRSAPTTQPAVPRGLLVEAVQMPAWAVRDGQRQPLSPGDALDGAQEIETAAGAGVVLRMPEGSLIKLGQKTRLGVQSLDVASSEGTIAVKSELKLFEGFFRFATSAVAKAVGVREVQVALQTATVGIRGTDFWSMTDAAHDAVCLFEGNVGLQTREQGALTLDRPTAFWARFFDKPVQPVGNATPDQLNTFLGSTEMKPGQGVAVPGGEWRVLALATADSRAALRLAGELRALGFPAHSRRARSARAAM